MEKLRETLEQLSILKAAIEASKAFIDQQPFFIKGFAIQDFTSSTGLSFEEWLRLIDSTISALQAGTLAQQSDARKLIDHLERYAQYAESIPDKIRVAAQFVSLPKEVMESAEQAPKLAEMARQLKQNLSDLLKEYL